MQKPKAAKQKTNLKSVRHFRLSEVDAKDWDAKVAASGMTESAFIRLAVIQNQTVVQAAKSKETTLEQRKLLFLFAQQSNNINQLAHQVNAAHRAGKVTPDLYLAVLEQLQSINTIAKGWIA